MTGLAVPGLRAAFMAILVSTAGSPLSFAQVTGAGDGRTHAKGASDSTLPPAADGARSGSFYLRAGIGLDWSGDARFTDEDCSSMSPAALYGCGDGPDGAPYSSDGDFGTMPGFEIGAGYVAAPFLRLEATVQHRPSITFEGRANFLAPMRRQEVSADLSVLSAMLAAYLDLPALGLPRLGPLSPFAGAGAGLSRIDIDETRMEFPKTRTIVAQGQRTNLAWMLTAGVAAPVGNNVILDLAWRYTDSGLVETGRGGGRVVWRDGSREPLELDLAETRADLTSHGIWASVRYVY